MSRIGGPALLGFSDYFSNDDVGAVAPGKVAPRPAARPGTPARPGAPAKPGAKPVATKASGKKGKYYKAYPKAKRTETMRNQGKVLSKARATVTKAAKLIGKAQMALAKRPPAVRRPAVTVTHPISANKTAVIKALPGKKALIGAAAVKKLTPKAQLAVKKHDAAVVKAKAAAKNLAQHAIKTRDAVKKLAKTMVTQKKMSKLLRTPVKRRPAGKATVGQILIGLGVEDAFNEYYSMIGVDPDPANPGYLTDGSPDPAYSGDYGATDPALAAENSGLSDLDLGLTDEPVDSGVELPAPPPMDQFIADMNAVGGIAYDNSKGIPNGFCGSYGLFTKATEEDARGGAIATMDTGRNYHGYVYGSFDQDQIPNGVPYGGRLKENVWHKLYGRYVKGGEGDWADDVPDSEAFTSYQKTAPNGVPFGPLVGNPGMADFKGMRVDAMGNMFWLPQEAPDWLTFPIKQAAALTAKAEAEAAAAAAKAFAAEQEKARMDEQAAQAAQDAANALAESQASSDSRISMSQSDAQMSATEVTAAQALVDQQRADTAQQQAQQQADMVQQQIEQEQMKSVADLMIQSAQREEAYFAQNPDLEMALKMQAAGVLGPEEGDEGGGGEEEAADDGGGYEEVSSDDSGDVSADDGGGAAAYEDDGAGGGINYDELEGW